MKRHYLALSGWCVVLFAAVAQAQSPAEAILKERKLAREGATYVLESEAEVLQRVNELKEAYRKWLVAQEKLTAADQNNLAITALTNQAAYLNQEKKAIGNQARSMPRLPRGGGFIRQSINQQIAAQQNVEQMAINEVNAEIAARKKLVPSAEARKGMESDVSTRKDEMVEAAKAARKLVDEANTAYEALAKDNAVKAAIAQVKSTTTDAIKLGPSKDFHNAVGVLDKAERLLNLKAPAESTTKKHHQPTTKPRPRKPAAAPAQPPAGA